MFINCIYLHDIGKLNPAFQSEKMKKEESFLDTGHSKLSALIIYEIFLREIEGIKISIPNKMILEYILLCFVYMVNKHHSSLENFEINEFINELSNFQDEEYLINCKTKESILKNLDFQNHRLSGRLSFLSKKGYNFEDVDNSITFYTLCRLLYSLIISCDHFATSSYFHSKELKINHIKDKKKLKEKFENKDVIKNIRKYQKKEIFLKDDDINKLRNEIFLECEGNLKKYTKNIYYIESPTGSGKTLNSINLGLNLLNEYDNLFNLFYIFPFNTLADQTGNEFDSFLTEYEDFIKINSLTPIIENPKSGEESINYEEAYQSYHFLNYPIVLTSHVNFFDILFGTNRNKVLLFQRLCNSVIILDEIQSYKNSIWKHIIKLLNKYSELLNIKIIIMSATLPDLNSLLDEDESNCAHLLENSFNYYKNPLFKDRVKLNFSLLSIKKEENLYIEINKIINNNLDKKILIEFIKKKRAREFYKKIKNKYPNVKIITGDNNRVYRENLLKEIKTTNNPVIIVSTQVLEAGADIDMDIGLKDISLLDSEEQFLGRINRSRKKTGMAYFFNLDNANKIYKNDCRLYYNLENKEIQEFLIKKDFNSFYNKVLIDLKKKYSSFNKDNINSFYNNFKSLKYENIKKQLRLIDNDTIPIILDETIEYNGEEIKSSKLFKDLIYLIENPYKDIEGNNISFEKNEVIKSQIKSKLSLFTNNIYEYELKDNYEIIEIFGDYKLVKIKDI